MRVERARFLEALHALDDGGYDEEIETLAMYFALYEKEFVDQVAFLKECLGELTVVGDPEVARLLAADALRESEYRWE